MYFLNHFNPDLEGRSNVLTDLGLDGFPGGIIEIKAGDNPHQNVVQIDLLDLELLDANSGLPDILEDVHDDFPMEHPAIPGLDHVVGTTMNAF